MHAGLVQHASTHVHEQMLIDFIVTTGLAMRMTYRGKGSRQGDSERNVKFALVTPPGDVYRLSQNFGAFVIKLLSRRHR